MVSDALRLFCVLGVGFFVLENDHAFGCNFSKKIRVIPSDMHRAPAQSEYILRRNNHNVELPYITFILTVTNSSSVQTVSEPGLLLLAKALAAAFLLPSTREYYAFVLTSDLNTFAKSDR